MVPATQLMVRGTAGDLPAKPGLLGGTGRSELRIFVLFLLEDNTSDWHVVRLTCQGKGGKEGLSVFVGVLRTFGF